MTGREHTDVHSRRGLHRRLSTLRWLRSPGHEGVTNGPQMTCLSDECDQIEGFRS